MAFGRAGEWSDIDLYILVDDGTAPVAFRVIERTLRSLSPISLVYAVQSGFEGVAQKFYKLKRASEYTVVDLAMVTFGSPEKFLTPEVHGENVFYFNNRNAVKVAPLDRRSLERRIEERVGRLDTRFSMFNNNVLKELKRETRSRPSRITAPSRWRPRWKSCESSTTRSTLTSACATYTANSHEASPGSLRGCPMFETALT